MKTSLSKTFSDLCKDKESTDLVFPERSSIRKIEDENSVPLNGENIFVIEPYNQDFSSDKTSLLLVNQTIKSQYDSALLKIDEKKEALFRELKRLSGLTGKLVNPESELLKVFEQNSIFDLFEIIGEKINNSSDKRLSSLKYTELFNEKTISFLNSGQISSQLSEYIKKYNELVEESPILNKSFNHYHAKTIQKNLSDNGFFSANHSVNLFDGKDKKEITSAKKLEDVIEKEKEKILSDKELLKKFDAIDKKLTNAELRKFRDYLFDNQDIVAELLDYKKLQQDVWIAYLNAQQDILTDLLQEYNIGKTIIKQAIDAAKSEKTEWEEVVKLFNNRFSVPFKVEVSNQEDVILKGSSPQISFKFSDDRTSADIERNSLLKILSQGEKRALYILNILFELNARKKRSDFTLLVVDDIADSFDYKNKYAIVEYLKDISELENFYSIFLTHNFDFHRTISSRLDIPRENKLFAVKNGCNLSLAQEKYQNNPFNYWKNNFHKNEKFIISAIPFVRNLAEYCGWNDEFTKLTSLLHLKSDTRSISIGQLNTIYAAILKDKEELILANPDKIVIDLIHEISEVILSEVDEEAELESKIILSMAIRLKAEEFMINRIANQSFVDSIRSNQTRKLLEQFTTDYPSEIEAVKLLDQVNLMTPENIHINSFMYEPILDMAPTHLKDLYIKVKEINA
jgi:energy-coupling factor transporter ATP-binding protein EcfA2